MLSSVGSLTERCPGEPHGSSFARGLSPLHLPELSFRSRDHCVSVAPPSPPPRQPCVSPLSCPGCPARTCKDGAHQSRRGRSRCVNSERRFCMQAAHFGLSTARVCQACTLVPSIMLAENMQA